ncbi:MAG: hypothetical protein QM765_04945 [Myxococcales bacterium]
MRLHLHLSLALALSAGCAAGEPVGESARALCVQDQPCTTDEGCQAGHVDCSTGTVTCTGLSARPEGTECGGGRVCASGRCSGCGAGLDCFEAMGCRRGTVDCASGAPVCGALVDEPDGKPCLDGECRAGACSAKAGADAGATPGDRDAGQGALGPPEVVRSGCQRGLSAPLLFGLVLLGARRRG